MGGSAGEFESCEFQWDLMLFVCLWVRAFGESGSFMACRRFGVSGLGCRGLGLRSSASDNSSAG